MKRNNPDQTPEIPEMGEAISRKTEESNPASTCKENAISAYCSYSRSLQELVNQGELEIKPLNMLRRHNLRHRNIAHQTQKQEH